MLSRQLATLMCGLALIMAVKPLPATDADGLAVRVDLELVLAADASGSVSTDLLRAQRTGFADAFRDPSLLRAILSGPHRRIAVAYLEWSDPRSQRIVVPWTLLEDPRDSAAFASELERAEMSPPGGETSISGAIGFARHLIDSNAYDGLRQVIDLASNGRNSAGPPMAAATAGLWEDGTTVNGLVLPGGGYEMHGPYGMLFKPFDGPLERYFETEVIGGSGAFVQAVDPARGFQAAILRKLVLEVAWVR